MTNTLTWGFKPIQLPKINAHLLSMISFFMLCLMLFTAAAIVYSVCETEYQEMVEAEGNYVIASIAYLTTETGLALAIISLNPIAIFVATAAHSASTIGLAITGTIYLDKLKKYNDCLEEALKNLGDSGGCDSGSCYG